MQLPDDFDAAAAKVAAGGASSNPVDDAARMVVDGQRTAAKASLYGALAQSPEVAARAVKLGRQTGLPSDVVARNLPEIERGVMLNDVDRLLEQHPAVVQALTSAPFAAVAQDDLENLGAVETVLRGVKDTGRAAMGGILGGSAGVVGAVQAPVDFARGLLDAGSRAGILPPGNPLNPLAEGIAAYRQSIEAQAKSWTPKAEGILGAGYYSGVGSFARNVAALPLAILNPAAGMAAMVAPVFGEEYGKARDKGRDVSQALVYGASQAAIEYATEKIPLGKLLEDVKIGSGLLKTLGRQVAAEVPGEQIATVLQDMNEWAVINPDKSFNEYIKERPSAAAQTLIATVVGVGGQVSTVKALEYAVLRGREGTEMAKRAEQDAALIDGLNKLASASKVAQRDPESFREFVEQAAADGPVQDVYIDARTFAQAVQAAGLPEAALPEPVRVQLGEALATGGDIRIPIADYAATIAPTEYAQGLLDHLKTDPQGMSRAEAQVYMQTQGEQLKTEVERTLAARAADQKVLEGAEVVRNQFAEQLNAANRFTPEVNVQYASLLANWYATTAQKLGLSPEELVARYPLRVQAEGVAGAAQQFDQPGAPAARVADFLDQFPARPPSGMDREQFRAFVDGRQAARSQLVKDLLPQAEGLLLPVRNGGFWGVTREARPDGEEWRVTRFDKDMQPLGHEAHRSAESAIDDVIQWADPERLRQPQQFNQSAAERDLVVTHNLTADNLLHAAKMGGLPVPSLAVTRKDTPLDGFGEITLIGKPEMADPKGYAKTRVFGADIYSPRYPSVERELDRKAYNAFLDRMRTMVERMGTELPSAQDLARDGQSSLERSPIVLAQFLIDQGISPTIIDKPSMAPERQARLEEFGLGPFLNETDYFELMDNPAFAKAALAEIIDVYESMEGNRAIFVQKLRTDEAAQRNMIRDTAREIAAAARQRQKPEIDTYATQRALEAQVRDADLANQFQQFVADTLEDITKSERIFQGFTNAGNRKYIPHTLENVVKILKADLRGGESFNYGVGSLRAKFTPQFKSVAEIRKNKDRLISAAEFEKVKTEIDAELVAVASAMSPDLSLDTAVNILEDAARMGVKPAAKSYGYEISDEAATQAAEFLTKLRHLPTAYFEAKIMREVSLAEFGGAVVPADVRPEVLDTLRAAGVEDIRTYERGNEADRAAKIGSFDNLFFQAAPAGNRGQIAFGDDITRVPSIITLLKNADLSTFLHESGHFFLEVQMDVAARIAGEAQTFGAATNTAGEQQILQDTQTLLAWFGVESLDEWFNLPMEQKRSYHEQFARGFEAYLFEGQAPSIELQSLFQRFRSWLLRVYRELKHLNVEVTGEVRQVMDRMLATDEQIRLAEAGRSMLPLFSEPQQAGMTTDEFAAYQDLGKQATADAQEDLQARTLRDLAYTRNARGREIKRLQKEAAARRSEVAVEARREIMSQPVYRAWRFLTAKMSENDKAAVAPPAPPKATSELNPEVDSLFVAIAKLGGLDRAQVESQWGWDRKERSPMPAFGKYLLRREDGLGIDAMGELLAEYGYLPKDENGKYDQRDFEDAFDSEYRGAPVYSVAKDYTDAMGEQRPGEGVDVEELGAGRLDRQGLRELGLPTEIFELIEGLKMTARDGIHPDIVAEQFGFTSGDELVRTLAIAEAPKAAIDALIDQKMLERYGELATPEAIERAADAAIHNDARARFVATELNALAQATGKPKVLAKAAKEYARQMIDRLLVRNVKPTQYAAAEVRAAKAAEAAMKSGDLATAAAEKRNQLVNTYATRAAYDAQAEVEKGLRYLKKFNSEGVRKSLDVDYLDQIDAILERFELRAGQSLKSIDKRKALARWLAEQEDLGLEVDLPAKVAAEAFRQSYKDLTVEEMRGLVDSIKQIEHLGRLKEKLLTAQDNRQFAAVVTEIVSSVEANAGGKRADNRTRDTAGNRAIRLFKGFVLAHRKMASLARELDGFKDAGPVWTYLIRSMNAAGDREATMRADATRRLTELLEPVLAGGRMGGKGKFFPTLGESLNRGEQLVLALNMGNAGNMQRLLDGRGWSLEQVQPVLNNLTAADWQFVQQVWDFFESYRPEIAAKERRVMGKEPQWVEPQPLKVVTRDAGEVELRGGYFPIVYDPRASGRAEQQADAEAARQQMKGAFVAATTRRSFTKSRAEAVTGRPLALTWDALFRGVNDVIHDLAWHEWVIDANRLIKNDAVDKAVRSTYGAEVIQQFKAGIRDIAAGDGPQMDALAKALTPLRQGAAVAGLGFNLMNAFLQPLGLTQSMVRIGPKWVAMGIARWAASPVELVKDVHARSEFMRNRARTQQRELNEIKSVVQGTGPVRSKLDALMFAPMQGLQLVADIPTWWGAYQKGLEQAPVDMQPEAAEELAVHLADQAVIDAQAGGQVKDLALIQRGGELQKLFTVFYGYFSAAYNLGVERAKATNYRSPLEVMHLAGDFLLLYSVPAVLAAMLKSALQPGGEDDDKELVRKLIGEQISYLMGLMVGVREATGAVQYITGTKMIDVAYGGPAGLRFFQELDKLGKQIGQGELDRALARSLVNVAGVALHLPSGQINRTVDGVLAMSEGKTDNPAALVFGVEK